MHGPHFSQIKAFVFENFVFDDTQPLSDGESLLDAGLIDSTGVLELVGYLEEAFAIEVLDEDIVPENMDSLNAISAYVDRKLSHETAAA